MSESGPGSAEPVAPGGGRRGLRWSGCLPVLVVLVLLGGLLYVGVNRGQAALESFLADPADYAGPGRDEIAVQVDDGDSVTEIGRTLKEQDVVASVDAFIDAAQDDNRSSGIQVGYYQLQERMSAADALAVLVDPDNLVTTTVTVPEGLRAAAILDILASETDFNRGRFAKVLERPGALGLPDYADGDPEGYLFPSTYAYNPDDTPRTMLTAMVDRWRRAAADADLEAAAERLGYTPHELMTVASLVEAEGVGEDMPRIARVIYNRLENPDNGVTNGLLQIDASVNYALGREPIARLSQAQIDSVSDSAYNTYTRPGLPPGPIEAPGDAAIQAAADPANGNALFYVTVNLRTGETKFTDSYEEFLSFRAELDEYCATQSDRC